MLLKATIINLPVDRNHREEAANVLVEAGFQNILHDLVFNDTVVLNATIETDFTQMADDTLMGVMKFVQQKLPLAEVVYRFG